MSREKHASLSGPPIRNSSGVVVKRDHKFFKTAGPAFTVAQPSAKFEFVDNTNPKKDIVVRRKAREWVHRDKDGKKCKEGPEDQNYPIKGQIIIHQEMCDLAQQSGHGILDVSTDRFDPFGVLPVPGTRKVDHIIEYCKLLSSAWRVCTPVVRGRAVELVGVMVVIAIRRVL
ncbi:hypothetical protein K469DRAFT_700693 [Zopfia rhizophila CBS 207.26]|uniref:Uncharacterized protein n=1 Tax=Zopfia rhizophila CBS 207.26 TaxID=1314779 RepID=A0A6A6EH91_9PEZI|nr:hypothetical protein K469DRAFT_700693 [Zopfia rhizophila CBS 207.26]